MIWDLGGRFLTRVDTFEVNELLPKFDCGLCGNPVCMGLARRILLNSQKPGDCRFISQGNLQKIQEIIPEKEVVRKHPHPNVNEDIIEIHPCTEDGKVTLETQLKAKFSNTDLYGDFFDQIQLCTSLSETEIFETMSCSPRLGYALLEMKGKRVHIFKTGKIIMRRADNREDALSTFSKISKVLLPSRVCSCGNILADCFGGGCDICSKGVCAALLDDLEVKEVGDNGYTTMGDLLKDFEEGSNESLAGNFKALGDIVGEVQKIDGEMRRRATSDKQTIKNRIDEIVLKVNKACINSILESGGAINTIIALTQYGLGRDLIRARDGFLSLEIKDIDEVYEQAKQLFFDAYTAFEGRDIEGSKAMKRRYEEIISTWNANPISMEAAKIATNGFYISRILGTPVPEVVNINMSRN